MEKQLLNGCAETLRRLRDTQHGTLDASVLADLDAVIMRLEACCMTAEDVVRIDEPTEARTLDVLATVLKVATNLTDLVKAFFDNQ